VVANFILVGVVISFREAHSASNSAGGRSPRGVMQSGAVEPAEVFDDGELELGAGAPDVVGDELGLEGVDEALGQGVIVGVADRADRGQNAVIGHCLGVVDRGVLRAAIAVMDQLEIRTSSLVP
jgi:hypothetical protein